MVNKRVVLLEAEERAVRAGQLGPQQQRHDPGQEEHDERRHHVVHADQLVIGAGDPLEQAGGPLVVLVLVLVDDRALGENGHAAAFVVELDDDATSTPWPGSAAGSSHARNWLGRQRHDVEEHERVVQPAQLGALGPVDAAVLHGQVEDVGDSGLGVAAEVELGHVEAVDDVPATRA